MYQVQNPMDRAMKAMSQAGGTYGSMMPNIPGPKKPGPTVGGGIMAGVGGAMMGAQAGSMMATPAAVKLGGIAAVGGVPALAIGAALGIGAYLLS